MRSLLASLILMTASISAMAGPSLPVPEPSTYALLAAAAAAVVLVRRRRK